MKKWTAPGSPRPIRFVSRVWGAQWCEGPVGLLLDVVQINLVTLSQQQYRHLKKKVLCYVIIMSHHKIKCSNARVLWISSPINFSSQQCSYSFIKLTAQPVQLLVFCSSPSFSFHQSTALYCIEVWETCHICQLLLISKQWWDWIILKLWYLS